ncbi:hypothetical protein TNCV_1671601 [Trichonephila clavipes]|nr:hypothetical protein TNCV_1671601 [Trichonephila clavipes]
METEGEGNILQSMRTPHQREDVSALDRFNVLRCPSRRVFSGLGLEIGTRQTTIRYLYHSATVATFSYLKLPPDGTFFHLNDELLNEVNRFLDSYTPQVFAEGIKKFPKHWQIIIDLNKENYSQ